MVEVIQADSGELVERLRSRSRRYQIGSEWGYDLRQAADTITSLQAEIERSRELNQLATFMVESLNGITNDQAAEIISLQATVVRLEAALRKAHALVDCIEQHSPSNLWWVNTGDPETAVCDTFDAIRSALSNEGEG